MKIAKKEKNVSIPQDSMADIAFLLIIFFMLTTTFSVNKGFDFGIPPTEQESTEDSESRPALTVIVHALPTANRDYEIVVVQADPSTGETQKKTFNKGTIKGNKGVVSAAWHEKLTDSQNQPLLDNHGRERYVDINVNADSLLEFMHNVFLEVKEKQPENWWKLPVYVLVTKDAPLEGFVHAWQEVQNLELGWKNLIPEDTKKLATHVPHVSQVDEILNVYRDQGQIDF